MPPAPLSRSRSRNRRGGKGYDYGKGKADAGSKGKNVGRDYGKSSKGKAGSSSASSGGKGKAGSGSCGSKGKAVGGSDSSGDSVNSVNMFLFDILRRVKTMARDAHDLHDQLAIMKRRTEELMDELEACQCDVIMRISSESRRGASYAGKGCTKRTTRPPISRLDHVEVVRDAQHVEPRDMAHVRRHVTALRPLVAATLVQSARGDDMDEEGVRTWSCTTWMMAVIFYVCYFGCIVGCWEVTKHLTKRALRSIGLGQVQPAVKVKSTMTEEEQPGALQPPPQVEPPRPAAMMRTAGNSYLTNLGTKYHTRLDCGHTIGRDTTTWQKCGDCSRLDRAV